MRRLVWSIVVLLAACGGNGSEPPEQPAEVVVVEAGWAVEAGRVGAAARLRNTSGQPAGEVGLRIWFEDAGGGAIWEATESLPACPAESDCWWAASFEEEVLGGRGPEVASVSVRVTHVEDGTPVPEPEEFDVRRGQDGAVTGEAPGILGTVYIVVSDVGGPRFGIATTIDPELRSSVIIGPDLLPPLEGERIRAYFYAIGTGGGS